MNQPDQVPSQQQSAVKGIDRRTVIRNAGVVGVGVVGAATLVACGGSDKETPSTLTTTAGADAAPGGVIKVAEIPVGGGKVFATDKVVVTQPKAGEFKAFSAVCTHKGCTVKSVENGTINCPCHGSKFDMATGAVTAGPAKAPLPGKTATVSGDAVAIS
jgi:Rieske Fe-S protein